MDLRFGTSLVQKRKTKQTTIKPQLKTKNPCITNWYIRCKETSTRSYNYCILKLRNATLHQKLLKQHKKQEASDQQPPVTWLPGSCRGQAGHTETPATWVHASLHCTANSVPDQLLVKSLNESKRIQLSSRRPC